MKKGIAFTVLVTILFCILFYWNSYRPSEIKKSCYREAIASAQEKFIGEGPSNLVPIGSEKTPREIFDEKVGSGAYHNADFESYYSKCLLKNGI